MKKKPPKTVGGLNKLHFTEIIHYKWKRDQRPVFRDFKSEHTSHQCVKLLLFTFEKVRCIRSIFIHLSKELRWRQQNLYPFSIQLSSLSRKIFSRCRLCNSPRFFNSPQIPHPFSVIIHNTIECNTLNSCLVHRNAEFRVDAERPCGVQRHTSRPKTTNAPSRGKDAHNDQKLIYEVCHHAGTWRYYTRYVMSHP